jgi:apolipoprotein N-acyltransferase
VFAFDAEGRWIEAERYRKRRLVPLVEWHPVVDAARTGHGPALEITPGTDVTLFSMGSRRFGVLICFESAFESLARAYRRHGADFLINMSNDAWSLGTAGPHQHEAHLVMRAIENRVGIVRAGNSGISEIIDPSGQRRNVTALDTRTFVTGTVFTTEGGTVYARLGDWVGLGSMTATLILVGLGVVRAVERAAKKKERDL